MPTFMRSAFLPIINLVIKQYIMNFSLLILLGYFAVDVKMKMKGLFYTEDKTILVII